MPRQILGSTQKQKSKLELGSLNTTSTRCSITEEQIDRILRKKRSKEYMETISKLDLGGHVCNKGSVDLIIEMIKEEMPELPREFFPIGFIAKCYLGNPYEVHIVDATGNIIKHYKYSESIPEYMERARSLAIHGGYDFIEVYKESLRAIKEDGTVSVIKG